MSNDNVKTMVDSLADGDNVAAQDAFKSALSDKIGIVGQYGLFGITYSESKIDGCA